MTLVEKVKAALSPGASADAEEEPGAGTAESTGHAGSPTHMPAIEPLDRQERIRLVAYRMYEDRGAVDGDPVSDWLAAEAEVALFDGSRDESQRSEKTAKDMT